MLTATPLAIAGWSTKGNYEPDTVFDQTDRWMELNPSAGDTGNHVYFNGFIGQGGGQVASDVNPNVGTVRSGNGDSHWSEFTMLGVWRDCNGDKFIGLGDQGLFEYRAELLVAAVNPGLCPVDPSTANVVHNDGKWIHEFVPIGWRAWYNDQNPYDINDNSSRIWYDFGLPTDGPASTCWLEPHPRGTYHSVGGLLFTYDCYDNYQVTDNYDQIVEGAGHRELSFGDHPRDQYNSGSTANVRNPWGEETDSSAVRAWDCGQPQLVQQSVPDPRTSGATLAYANVSAPNAGAPGSLNPAGSPSGTANATGSGLDRCDRRTDVNGGGRGGAAATAPYAAEGDVVQAASKQGPQGNLNPITTPRGAMWCPVNNDPDPSKCDVAGTTYPAPATLYAPVTGDNTPGDFGIRNGVTTRGVTSNGVSVSGPQGMADGFWSENVLWFGFWPTAATNGGLAGAAYTTYYAYVSPGAVSAYNLILPPGGTGAYGGESCGSHTSGIFNGWDCDATHWYKDANGVDTSPHSFYLGRDANAPTAAVCSASGTGATSRGCINYAAYPGSPFNLRDIDCWDDSNMALRPTVTEEAVAQVVTGLTNPSHPADLCAYPTP